MRSARQLTASILCVDEGLRVPQHGLEICYVDVAAALNVAELAGARPERGAMNVIEIAAVPVVLLYERRERL